MKPMNYILITVILVFVSLFGYDYYKKTSLSKTNNNNNNTDDGKPYVPKPKGSEKVKDLQRSLNTVLKLHNKTILNVDGIKGDLTKKAIIDVANLQNSTPSKAHIFVEGKGNVAINYDLVYSKTKQFIKDISGYSTLSNLFS